MVKGASVTYNGDLFHPERYTLYSSHNKLTLHFLYSPLTEQLEGGSFTGWGAPATRKVLLANPCSRFCSVNADNEIEIAMLHSTGLVGHHSFCSMFTTRISHLRGL